MTQPTPWDSGLQIERTKLAWQRTALSTLAFCLLVARLVAIYSWPLAAMIASLAAAAAVVVGLTASRRYRRGDRALRAATPLPDARAFGALAGLTVVAGLGGLIYLLASWTAT